MQHIATHVEIGAIADLHHPAVADGGNQRLAHQRHTLTIRPFDLHRIADAQHALLNAAQLAPLHILEAERLTDAQGFSIHLKHPLTVFIFDPKIIANRDQTLTHAVARGSAAASECFTLGATHLTAGWAFGRGGRTRRLTAVSQN